MKLCQMNLLASLWVGDIYAQLPCYDQYIASSRLRKTLAYLKRLECDVYCLSEVEEDSISIIEHEFGADWELVYVSHEPGFWSEWLEDKDWKSNGTCVLLRSSRLVLLESEALKLKDGCNSTLVLCEDRVSCRTLSIASIHLDTTEAKWIEAETLALVLEKLDSDVQIISGDFNFTDVSLFHRLGYIEAAGETQSTPINLGRIDHTLIRGASHASGTVLDLGDPCSTVAQNGSDHYATVCTIIL